MSILNFLPHAVGQAQAQIMYGEVSRHHPPLSFSDPLYVVIPDWSPDHYTIVPNWPALHGVTLPQPGNPCLLLIDNRGTTWCVSWTGVTAMPNYP